MINGFEKKNHAELYGVWSTKFQDRVFLFSVCDDLHEFQTQEKRKGCHPLFLCSLKIESFKGVEGETLTSMLEHPAWSLSVSDDIDISLERTQPTINCIKSTSKLKKG